MTDILIYDFVYVLLIFLRVVAIFVASPVFGHKAVPVLTKIFLAIVIAYIVFLTTNNRNLTFDLNLVSLIVYSFKEILTGLIMGFILNFVFWGVAYAGNFMGFDIGLMFAQVANAFDDSQNNVLSEIFFFGAILVFFLINGHHYVITGVVASFAVIPIGKYTINQPVFLLIIKYSFAVFTIAVKIASPIMVAFFLVHIAAGIIAKVIPNIQVFFVFQPLKLGLGFLLLTTATPFFIYAIKILLQNYEQQLFELVKAMGS